MQDNSVKEALEKMIRENHERMKAQNPDIRDLKEHELTMHSLTGKNEKRTIGGNPRMMKKSHVERSKWSDNFTLTTEGAIHGAEVSVRSSIYGDIPVKQFLGVPYAKPPIGELRFRKTEKPFKYFGIRECTQFTSGSMQLSTLLDDPFADPGFSGTYHTEDSLYLNIWSPAERTDEKLPIVVWVHGGGMTNSTAMADYRMAHFLAAHGVIVACVNYRLGFFGFFAHKDLEDANGCCGNYALYDIKQAVEWMRDNAEAFGGDPDNITVGGQSGGAFASNLMLVSPLMNGLIKRVIIESGSCFHGMMQPKTKEQAESEGEEFCKKHNVTVAELMKMDPVDIIALTAEDRFVPNAIIDGAFITEMPQDTLLNGAMNKVDVIVTATAQEFAARLTENTVSPEQFEKYVRDYFGDKADLLLRFYPHSDGAESGHSYYTLLGDIHFIGVIRTAEECAAHGLNTYAGYFSRPVSGEDGELVGALHSSELPYLFGRVNHGGKTQLGFVEWRKSDYEHAETINGMWTNFIRAGNPGYGWKKFESRFDIMDFGVTKQMMGGADAARLQAVYDIIAPNKFSSVGDYICRDIPLM